jgi:response regulator RpfG family c-di-GMP phosphodiesterase
VLAQSDVPDLILLDLMMPGMDGFEVTRNLKAKPITQNIPIIVVSSLDDIASRQRMVAIGIDEFIVKPIDRWELSRKMTALLKLTSPNVSSQSEHE